MLFVSNSPPVFLATDHIFHAAVCSLRDAQPGRLHPLLPERSARQLSGGLSAGETDWTLTRLHSFALLERGIKHKFIIN